MDERIQELEDALLEDPNFEKVTLSASENTATFTAYAVDGCKRSSEAAVEEYTNRFGGSPGMDLAVAPASGDSSMGTMMGGGNTKTVTLVADSLDVLEQGADQVADAMSQVPGVIRVANEFDQSRVKGRLVVDSQKAQALGTSESAVAMQVYYLLNGMTAHHPG